MTYKRPSQLPDGQVLVIGASAYGLQIARELALSGRQVTLAVGQHTGLPCQYRGADILTWMHLVGVLDAPFTKVDDLAPLRSQPSLALLGGEERVNLNLATLQALGVRIVARLASVTGGRAWFSGSLANLCGLADLKMNMLPVRKDALVVAKGFEDPSAFLPASLRPRKDGAHESRAAEAAHPPGGCISSSPTPRSNIGADRGVEA